MGGGEKTKNGVDDGYDATEEETGTETETDTDAFESVEEGVVDEVQLMSTGIHGLQSQPDWPNMTGLTEHSEGSVFFKERMDELEMTAAAVLGNITGQAPNL